MKFHYRNALVTGASSGIGAGLSRELARRGIAVFLAARRTEALEALREEIVSAGFSAHAVQLDVADTERTVAQIRELDREQALELVIANAGVGANHDAPVAYSWEAMRDALHTNFCGAAATLTAVLPDMVRRGRGHLVGIGSLASLGPLPLSAAYCAPKAGLHMLLECLRLDMVDQGITVTNVQVGFVATPMLERVTHPTPGLMSVEEASAVMGQGILDGREDIVFPRVLAFGARAAGMLPRVAQKAIARGVGKRIR